MKRKLMIGVVAGLTAYYVTKKQQEPEPTFEWISADADEEDPEPMPMFYVGDKVHLYSPYTTEFHTQEWAMAPEEYKIIAVKYDEDEEVFRYQLKNGMPAHWYSEDWISLPTETTFIREWSPKVTPDGEVTPEVTEAERKILDKAHDDQAKQTQIDFLLDRMNNGTDEEIAQARKALENITKGA